MNSQQGCRNIARVDRDVRYGPKIGKIGTKYNKSGKIRISFHYISARESNVRKLGLTITSFIVLSANLFNSWFKSDIPVEQLVGETGTSNLAPECDSFSQMEQIGEFLRSDFSTF